MTLPAELASLPEPNIIAELNYETRLAELVERLVQQMSAHGVEYDVGALETDPAVILTEVMAYADLNLRQRINEAARANLLAYATGADLDILAQFYDVSRLYSETDDALRRRVVLAIQGRSTGGTAPRYRYVALSADPLVSDAVVYSIDRDPTVRVAIFSGAGGVVSPALIAKVDAALQNDAVRMVNDVIVVEGAVEEVIDVAANIWLQPSASSSLIAEIETALRSAWTEEMTLGHDVTLSWLYSKLQVAGVHKIEITAPIGDLDVPFNRAAALGTVSLSEAGRDF